MAPSGNGFWGFDYSAPMALFLLDKRGSIFERLAAFCPTDGFVSSEECITVSERYLNCSNSDSVRNFYDLVGISILSLSFCRC